MIASVLAFVLVLGLASAALTFSNVPTLEQNLSSTSFSFDIKSADNDSVDFSIDTIVTSNGNITFDSIPTMSLVEDVTETITVSYTFDSNFEFEFGKTYSTTMRTEGHNLTLNPAVTKALSFESATFCEFGKRGNDLEIVEINIDNLGNGDDEEWELLDEIEIEVSVENTDSNDKIRDVEVEIKILNEAFEDVTNDFFEDSDDKILDFGSIQDDTEETKTILLKVGPEMEEEKYYIYYKVYKENNEDIHCIEENEDTNEYYIEFDVILGDNDAGIDELEYTETLACSETTSVSFDFYNFDLADKEEDMRVNLYNHDLGIDLYSDKFDLRKWKYEELYFDLTIPEHAEEKKYTVKVYYDYDYDEDDEEYGEINEDAGEFTINVEGNCVILEPGISQVKDSVLNAKEGKVMTFEMLISNPNDEQVVYTFESQGNTEWSDFVETNPVILAAGAEQKVMFEFNLEDNSQGEHTFQMRVLQDGDLVKVQPVTLNVEKSGLVNFDKYDFNWKLIGIVILNLILIVAIILVAVRMKNKK